MVTQELIDRCVTYIKGAPDAEDGGGYILGAIELAKELEAAEESPRPQEESFPEYLSRAVIASSGAGDWGVVLWYEGPDLEREIEEVGQGLRIDNIGLFDAPEGISVWEGCYHNDEGALEADGSFRELTAKEWSFVHRGESPWG